MITENELRIGNWLKNFIGEYFQVNTATIQSFIDGMHPFGCPMPIPLTPEILEKVGFEEYDDINKRWTLGGIEYYNEKIWFGTSEIDVKYLHQLQNLYFALTGQELEIQL